jgi:hypothetical protein
VSHLVYEFGNYNKLFRRDKKKWVGSAPLHILVNFNLPFNRALGLSVGCKVIMNNLNDIVAVYHKELRKGDILVAYNELVKFLMNTRTELVKKLDHQYSFAKILHGYMDYTYFYYTNDFLKSKKLKLGLVLNHLEMRFEVWLLGNTIPVQKEYWNLLKSTKWNKDKTEMPQYSIIEAVIIDKPDFNNLESLSKNIHKNMVQVTDEIIALLKNT